MLSKNKIKQIHALSLLKHRKAMRLFTAEGSRLVLDFLESDSRKVKELFASPEWLKTHGNRYPEVIKHEVTGQEMKKISNLKTPSEVLAVIAMPDEDKTVSVEPGKWYLALDGIRDPGNLGTIIRTAEWFGIDTIFCSADTVDVFNPKVVQATMGSLSRVSIVYTGLTELFQKYKNIPVYGTLLEGIDISGIKNPEQGIILIGSEAQGISKELIPHINYRITIPPAETSKAESLNASIAAAVVCYALLR